MNGEAKQISLFLLSLPSPFFPPPPSAATTDVADFVVFDALWRVDEEQATGGSKGWGRGSSKCL